MPLPTESVMRNNHIQNDSEILKLREFKTYSSLVMHESQPPIKYSYYNWPTNPRERYLTWQYCVLMMAQQPERRGAPWPKRWNAGDFSQNSNQSCVSSKGASLPAL